MQKVFHSSVKCAHVSPAGLVVILSMEKDNNLDSFFSTKCFQSADAMNGVAY